MIVLEVDQVEVDHCVGCGGTWLDAGELELLLDGATNRDEVIASLPAAGGREVLRRCPMCEKPMEKVRCNDELLDRCVRGDGLWFDAGELRAVIRAGAFAGENRIYELLNDVFGGE
jgi:Zn-finger nucleic acid-binding protein